MAEQRMRAAIVSKPGAEFELVERPVPEPGPDEVRIKVDACGICHSDVFVKQGLWPGITYPRAAGHEVAGIIDAVGARVTSFKKGQRVGVGWFGGKCGECRPCREGNFVNCRQPRVTGISFDGGYQEFFTVPADAVAALPDGITDIEVAPLLCAGVTTYNALRHSGARPGDLVVVQGIGGLGHLGIQFASRFGYRVVAVGRGPANAPLAEKLGAERYLDTQAVNAAEALQQMGGARVILSTAPNSKAMSMLFEGLGPDGKLMVVGASTEPLEISPIQLIANRRSIQGWPSGTATDSEDAVNFAVQTGVRPMVETFPLERVNQAYERMMSGHAEFRVVMRLN